MPVFFKQWFQCNNAKGYSMPLWFVCILSSYDLYGFDLCLTHDVMIYYIHLYSSMYYFCKTIMSINCIKHLHFTVVVRFERVKMCYLRDKLSCLCIQNTKCYSSSYNFYWLEYYKLEIYHNSFTSASLQFVFWQLSQFCTSLFDKQMQF